MRDVNYTENELPHPHDVNAFGLSTIKREPMRELS
jgi:hypothetical protein